MSLSHSFFSVDSSDSGVSRTEWADDDVGTRVVSIGRMEHARIETRTKETEGYRTYRDCGDQHFLADAGALRSFPFPEEFQLTRSEYNASSQRGEANNLLRRFVEQWQKIVSRGK